MNIYKILFTTLAIVKCIHIDAMSVSSSENNQFTLTNQNLKKIDQLKELLKLSKSLYDLNHDTESNQNERESNLMEQIGDNINDYSNNQDMPEKNIDSDEFDFKKDQELDEIKRSPYLRFGRSPAYLRFGRAQAYLRFGKRAQAEFLRFGKRKPAYLRFGRNFAESETNLD